MSRILFLDVDGPLIPSGMYLINRMASFQRLCSPIAVAVVNRLCKESGAKIVMNSSHNNDDALLTDLIREGIEGDYFHKEWRTVFPAVVNGLRRDPPRFQAIQKWISENSNVGVDWICFDDYKFISDGHPDANRLIYVDFDHGIHPGHYNEAAQIWNVKGILIL
jgi:hypothetical protein